MTNDKIIGGGSEGVVYKVFRHDKKRYVAIKKLNSTTKLKDLKTNIEEYL